MQLFWKLKTFPQVFIIFYESTLNLEHFEKKKPGLIGQVFLKLLRQKDVLI